MSVIFLGGPNPRRSRIVEDVKGGLEQCEPKTPRRLEWISMDIQMSDKAANSDLFHTYSCFARGADMMNAGYHYLELVPKGRDEKDLQRPQAWVRHRETMERLEIGVLMSEHRRRPSCSMHACMHDPPPVWG